MRTFVATIFSVSGEERVIRLKGATQEVVRQHLHEQGFTIKKLMEEQKSGIWQKLQAFEVGSPIKPQNRIRLLKTLGKMINRGYILERVFDFLLADEHEKDVVKLLRLLQGKAQRGYKDYVELFHEARDYFDQEFFSILLAGQKTGTVGQNIIDYAEGKERMLEQKGALLRVLSGKFLVLAIVLMAFIVIVTFVVPQFMKLFGDKLQLPFGMKIMVWFSELISHHGVLLLIGSFILVLLVVIAYKASIPFRFLCQHSVLRVPVLGTLLRMMHTRDFLYMMGNLISKRVALMEAMRIVVEQTANLCFRSVYSSIEKNLEKGRKLDQVLKPLDASLIAAGWYVAVPQGYLLESVAQAMTLGSKGGNLGEMLTEAYLTYDFQLQNRIGLAIKVVGGAISLFTYLLIIFMIGSLAMTLFKVMEDPTAIAQAMWYAQFHQMFI